MCQIALKPVTHRESRRNKCSARHLFIVGLGIGICVSFILSKATSGCSNISSSIAFDSDTFLYNEPVGVQVTFSSTFGPMNIDTHQEFYVNESKRLILVGVMTANKYLSSRALAVYNTWAKDFPGKIIFFTGANVTGGAEPPSPDFPMVALPGVDDSYPPQKKSFMMLKYMYDHYIDKFQWFLRADDDVYINTNKLSDLLHSLRSSHLYYLGQAGRGTRAERGTLHLKRNENFCMGGPGNVFSRATLRRVAPHVQECLQHMYSTHEDVELGRCVHRFAGISCTWAYEMQSIFYHNFSGDNAFTGNLKHREVHRAVTLHPIKHQQHLYRLHSYFQERELEKLFYEAVLTQRELLYSEHLIENGGNLAERHPDQDKITAYDLYNISGLPPSLQKFSPSEASEVIRWSFIGKGGLSEPNSLYPKHRLYGSTKEGLQDVIREVMELINGMSKVRGRVIEFKELFYGYHRLDPVHGEDYVLDLLMTYKKYRGRKMTVAVRRHAYVQRPFMPLQLRRAEYQPNTLQIPNSASHDTRLQKFSPPKIVFIVPLSGRVNIFWRFLENFKIICQEFHKEPLTANIGIVVIYFGNDTEKTEFLSHVKIFKQFVKENFRKAENSNGFCKISLVELDSEFSRGIGLETGISQCSVDDLLFLVDVDIVISAKAVRRVLANTIQNVQVYFPVVFSEYSNQFFSEKEKGAEVFEISGDSGYWREFGFGIVAFFKSDYKRVGGFDVSIRGWGKEDVALFDKFIQTNLTVFRAPDPEIVHMYHPIICNKHLAHAQKEMCHGSKARTLGSEKNLLRFILKNRRKSHRLHGISKLLFESSG